SSLSVSCSVAGARPALHSFPTRRSSDLAPASEAGPPRADPAVLARRKMLPRRGVRGSTEAKLRMLQEFRESQPAPKEEKAKEERSEEHTSELQSRENLVCRLLLEKKKTE